VAISETKLKEGAIIRNINKMATILFTRTAKRALVKWDYI